MHRFVPDTFKIFMTLRPTESHCEGCPFLNTYIEEYEIWGGIDRREEIDCSGNHLDCPRVPDEVIEVQGFIDDNTEMFNLIKELE
jgi:hypothetical protein